MILLWVYDHREGHELMNIVKTEADEFVRLEVVHKLSASANDKLKNMKRMKNKTKTKTTFK